MNQTELNKQIIRRFIDEVVNTGKVGLLADLVSPDCVETDGRVRTVSGVNGKIVEHSGAANMLEPFLEAGSLQPVSPGAQRLSVRKNSRAAKTKPRDSVRDGHRSCA